MAPSKLPPFFRSLRALRSLSTVGVSLALASATAAVLGGTNNDARFGLAAFVAGLPTALVCVFWMRLLRWRATVGKSQVRLGWVLSLPLAALNGGLAAAVWLGGSELGAHRLKDVAAGFLGGFLLGVSVGAIVWLPALVMTLLVFGLPLAWAQRQASQGLAGEERGERVVGLAAAIISALSLLRVIDMAPDAFKALDWVPAWQVRLGHAGFFVLAAMAAVGLGAGALSVAFSTMRDRKRQRFVADTEAGKVAGYRVDPTPEGKVLVRVASQDESYRVADLDEELFALDADGNARQPALQAPASQPSLAPAAQARKKRKAS